MKRIVQFLKTTMLGGLFTLLPIVLIFHLLGEVVHIAQKTATPILKLLPRQIVTDPTFPILFDLAVISLACFGVGLLLRSAMARSVGRWIERYFLQPLPGYGAVRNLTSGLRGSLEAATFKAAAVASPDGGQQLAYLIEDHGDGLATVMLPWSPNPASGLIKVVRREQVEVLDVKLATLAHVISLWGVGAQELLRKKKPQ
jgi:uncharacterized membrane protein